MWREKERSGGEGPGAGKGQHQQQGKPGAKEWILSGPECGHYIMMVTGTEEYRVPKKNVYAATNSGQTRGEPTSEIREAKNWLHKSDLNYSPSFQGSAPTPDYSVAR